MERVFITGASAGVGKATALEFAKAGALLGLLARDEERLAQTKEQALQSGAAGVATFSADVASFEQLNRAACAFVEKFDGLDVWINNAMASVFAPFHDITPEEYRRVTDVTYHGYVWGTQIALREMEKRQKGRIVLVGSALAYRGIPLQSAYCGAKHAVQGMFDSLRSELLHRGSPVSVGMAHLPAVNTPQFNWTRNKLGQDSQPVPPIFQPEVAARAIYWMAHNKKRELYVGAPTIMAVVGNKVLPGLGDWYLAKTGYKSQQTNKKLRHPEHDNLFCPSEGDYGAHGSFDDVAKKNSPALWAAQRKGSIAAFLGALGLAGTFFWRRRN